MEMEKAKPTLLMCLLRVGDQAFPRIPQNSPFAAIISTAGRRFPTEIASCDVQSYDLTCGDGEFKRPEELIWPNSSQRF